MVDLTKLIYHSGYPAFKNNDAYTGSFVISGTISGGVNTQTVTIQLSTVPDILDILFGGRGDNGFAFTGIDPRPDDGWFKEGAVFVRGDNAGDGFVNEATRWGIAAKLEGSTIVVTATNVQQFGSTLTLTPETVSYRIVDYSVF